MKYELLHQDGRARRGRITLERGTIETPVFMPVGTAATVKGMMPRDLAEAGTTISLANTYHLHIQPGEKLVHKAGGLHRFMAMPWPILTDSGGFQVFSLPRRELSENGVVFEFRKGAKPIVATPEWSMQVQMDLGADIIMAFDECAPWPCPEDYARQAMERTLRWLDRCIAAHHREDQNLFPIVQGSTFDPLRRESALRTIERDQPGYAIGGVSVGEGHSLMMQAVDGAEPFLPTDRPRYLMGVGLPEDIVGAVGRGMDMFDCVIPTRYGRSGTCFTRHGRLRITDRRYRNDHYPIDPSCQCYACRNFSRAYLQHCIRSDEILGTMMCTLHNVHFYHDLMRDIRSAIAEDRYAAFCRTFESDYIENDRQRRREDYDGGLFHSFDVGVAAEWVRQGRGPADGTGAADNRWSGTFNEDRTSQSRSRTPADAAESPGAHADTPRTRDRNTRAAGAGSRQGRRKRQRGKR
ncbi:MAG: tRNA guanosine(34) transglycosylase Tgt [Deltaproteobacteria bacterium]|nr:MAG: tRNA guanosine(34) transglycosylase Tgt [Deltaproteobacteria bacterium]